MPTIEVVSIDSTELGLNPADFHFAIIEENKMESHRGLFYNLLRQQKGVIVHIGNPYFKEDKDGGFFAGQLIDWNFEPGDIIIPQINPDRPTDNLETGQQFKFKFLEQFKSGIDKLLKISLDKSPIKKVCFLTDYQFGPEKEKLEIIDTISQFWIQHDSDGLDFNTLYEFYGR